MQSSYRKITVGSIIAVYTLLQLLILVVFGYTPYPDSNGYILLAQDSVKYGETYPIASKAHEIAFLWNLGSINITALSLFLFGSIKPVLVLYSFLKGATAWLTYAITQKLFGNKIAFFTLLLYIIYPANYGEGTSLLSETPFLFFCLLGIYLSITHSHIIGGICIGIGNWFRPMGLVFLLSLIIYYAFNNYHIKRRFINLLFGYAIILFIIGSINFLHSKRFIYQAQTGWMALMQYSWDHDSDKSKDYQLFVNKDPNNISHRHLDYVQKDSVWRSHFIIWLQNNPLEYISQMPQKLVDIFVSDNVNMCTFIPYKDKKEYMYEEVSMNALIKAFPHFSPVQILTLINLSIYYLLLIGALFQIILSAIYRIRKKKEKLFISKLLPMNVIIIGTLVLLLFGHGEARFHIPFMPFIIMLASITILQLIERTRRVYR